MPVERKDENKLALVSRMLTYQQAKGESISDSLKSLAVKLPDEYRESIDDVQKMMSGDGRVFNAYTSRRFLLLKRLMAVVQKEGGDPSKILANIDESIVEGINQADDFWRGFHSVMSYLITVFALSMMVASIFMIKVLPQFKETFDDFGVELPEFTRLVLDNDIALLFVIVGIAICTIGISLLSFHVKRRVEAFEPLSQYCRLIPGVRDLHAIYGYFLYIQYSSALIQAGVESSVALKQGQQLVELDTGNVHELLVYVDALDLANEIRVLDKELLHQSRQVNSRFTRQMITIRDTLTRGTQAALGVVVGGLIIAMYLPIFVLGSAV